MLCNFKRHKLPVCFCCLHRLLSWCVKDTPEKHGPFWVSQPPGRAAQPAAYPERIAAAETPAWSHRRPPLSTRRHLLVDSLFFYYYYYLVTGSSSVGPPHLAQWLHSEVPRAHLLNYFASSLSTVARFALDQFREPPSSALLLQRKHSWDLPTLGFCLVAWKLQCCYWWRPLISD